MDLGLSGKNALVTGGGGRVGSTICRTLAAEGSTAIALDVDADAAEETAAAIRDDGDDAVAQQCDITDETAVDAALEEIRESVGGIDVLVNSAAVIGVRNRLGDFDDEEWRQQLEVDLTGTYNVSKRVFPEMCDRNWGRIVNMSSMAGWHGGFGQAGYSTTKAGLIGLGKTMALEGAQQGVTANVIAPNVVVGQYADMEPDELAEEVPYYERIRQATPMRKLGREEDVASLIAFLASEQANYITGQVIGVTGGIDLWTF